MPRRQMNVETGEVREYREGEGWVTIGPEVPGGAFGAALITAGESLSGLGRSPEQEAESRRLLGPLRERYPVATAAGDILPYAATAVVPGAQGAAVGRIMAGEAALGVGLGGLRGAESTGERLANMAIEGGLGALGGYVGSMAGRVASRIMRSAEAVEVPGGASREIEAVPAGEGPALRGVGAAEAEVPNVSGLTAAEREVITEADALGFETLPMHRRPRQGLERVEGALQALPWAGRPIDEVRGRNLLRLHQYLGRGLGLGDDVDSLGPRALDAAEEISEENFNNLAYAIEESGGVRAGAIRTAVRDAREQSLGIGRDQADQLLNQVEEAIDRNTFGGNLATSAVLGARRELSNARRTFSSQGAHTAAQQADDIIEAIDDAIERAVGPAERANAQRARDQWRLLRAIRQGAAVRPDGTINTRSLDSNLRRWFKSEYGLGRDSSLDPGVAEALGAARVGASLSRAFPDSGTATRRFSADLLAGGAASAAALNPLPLAGLGLGRGLANLYVRAGRPFPGNATEAAIARTASIMGGAESAGEAAAASLLRPR